MRVGAMDFVLWTLFGLHRTGTLHFVGSRTVNPEFCGIDGNTIVTLVTIFLYCFPELIPVSEQALGSLHPLSLWL